MARFLAALSVFALLFGHSTAGNGTIVIKGSDTLVRLGQAWSAFYMQANEGIHIRVSGGGSGNGITALILRSTDICEASRNMTEEEYARAEKNNVTPVRIPVVLDGIVVFVNKSNPVSQLNYRQLKGIFTGEITNWKEVGGNDAPIVPYGRESISGTYAYFKHHVLRQKSYANSVQALPGTASMVNAVSKDVNGIGYGGITWVNDVKYLALSDDSSHPAVKPNPETISNGTYPLSRELYWFFNGSPSGSLKNFVNWALSPEAQGIAERLNYVPLPADTAKKYMIP